MEKDDERKAMNSEEKDVDVYSDSGRDQLVEDGEIKTWEDYMEPKARKCPVCEGSGKLMVKND